MQGNIGGDVKLYSDVCATPVRWLWYPFIAIGKLTFLQGDPGDTPNWSMKKIYSDEGKSGTSTKHREAFNQMIEDAAKKDFDLIICASVSRFARNMSDCMSIIRQLKTKNPSHPVGVYFETENIYTLKEDSMQSLSIHAMLADWESATKSSRMFLSYDQRIIMG